MSPREAIEARAERVLANTAEGSPAHNAANAALTTLGEAKRAALTVARIERDLADARDQLAVLVSTATQRIDRAESLAAARAA